MTLEPERDNPNDIHTKLAQHVQVAHKMTALSSDWSAHYASSNAEYNILRRKFFVRGDTEHALRVGRCQYSRAFLLWALLILAVSRAARWLEVAPRWYCA